MQPITSYDTPGLAVEVQGRPLYTRWERCRNALTRLMLWCVAASDVVDDWERDDAVRGGVRQEMLRSESAEGEMGPSLAIECGVSKAVVGGATVAHHPRLVAAAVASLRVKLGVGAMVMDGPEMMANRALVRREAAKLMREWNVRDMDGAAHLVHIERAFFEDDTHYRSSDWRRNAARELAACGWVAPRRRPAVASS